MKRRLLNNILLAMSLLLCVATGMLWVQWGFDYFLWVFVLSTAVLPLLWLNSHVKKRRRLKHGLCPTCGYDLRASKDRCPECGTAIPVQEAKA
jgi:hypothetical protein